MNDFIQKLKTINFMGIAYNVGMFGIVLILLWIGIFKFTPTEAAAIEPLARNSPLMSWMYTILSVQAVSNLIGISEIIIAFGLLSSYKFPKIGVLFGLVTALFSLITLSFLITTPGVWKIVDGVITTHFFLLKDILILASSLLIVGYNLNKIN